MIDDKNNKILQVCEKVNTKNEFPSNPWGMSTKSTNRTKKETKPPTPVQQNNWKCDNSVTKLFN